MNTVGERERRTQQRVVELFRKQLGYDYLGDWHERASNRNVEEEYLRPFLRDVQGYSDALITRALHLLITAANDSTRSLYDRNRDVYAMLRYGVKVKPEAGENTETVWLVDWLNPERNHFAIAEEVAVKAVDQHANGKRPDVVIYVNGIALGVLELKRSFIDVAEGIRQNLDNQTVTFIEHYFSTMRLVMAGNDTQGLRYGTIQTPEKYYLTWKEASDVENPLHRSLLQICDKRRFLELIHDYVVFDAGKKKLCRAHQYFGVRAAQEHVRRREGGVIWHTQGSGKSLTMVWLAKWLREHQADARVLIITDRDELDQQIETIFMGVDENIYRTKSGADLIAKLNASEPWLLCSLVHKFGGKDDDESDDDVPAYVEELTRALPPDFRAKGNLFVFVDECHRTQSGKLHDAMKAIMPDAMFIGFTGTPLIKTEKQSTLERFGPYIHTYKFDEAVYDGVVLDLRYEARDIDQVITSQQSIDNWFELKTNGLTAPAKAQLKQRWGTMRKLLSSKSRLEQIVADILMDMEQRPRLKSGHGNAMLVCGSIYQACKYYELFENTELKGSCAIITSYTPNAATIKGEETGEGATERLRQYEVYQRMLATWFHEPASSAVKRIEEFEKAVKKRFIEQPGQMKLLIVVDKLLTGFDAPSATYLYIDKQMRDHGLFQAICRVNRLDGDDKGYGYIVDYKDLFRSLESAVELYTSGAFDGYDPGDVEGLLKNRLEMGRKHFEEILETVRALCEPVEPPRTTLEYVRYFGSQQSSTEEHLMAAEPKRVSLYKHVASLIRAFADIADEMLAAGYSATEAEAMRKEVDHYVTVRDEVKVASGDHIDLKKYEPAMRHLIDMYIRANESQKISELDDLSLVELIVERGAGAIDSLPEGIRKSREAVAETIENNVRRLIIDEQPINPKYYEKMSQLLDALIEQRRQEAIEYKEYLEKLIELTRQAKNPGVTGDYPPQLETSGKRALYDNLDSDLALALAVDHAIVRARQDGWRSNHFKVKQVKNAIRIALETTVVRDPQQTHEDSSQYAVETLDERVERILTLVTSHRNEY